MKLKLQILFLSIFSSLTCFGIQPITSNLVYHNRQDLLDYNTNQDSITFVESVLLMKNAGNELIKAEKKLYLGLTVIGVGAMLYSFGNNKNNKFKRNSSYVIMSLGALYSVSYMRHIGNAGRILNNLSSKKGSGLHIKSSEDGLGLAFNF